MGGSSVGNNTKSTGEYREWVVRNKAGDAGWGQIICGLECPNKGLVLERRRIMPSFEAGFKPPGHQMMAILRTEDLSLVITNKLASKKSFISKCTLNIHFADHHMVVWNRSSVLLCAQESMSQPSSSFLCLLPTQGLLPLQNESQRVRTCSKLSPPSLPFFVLCCCYFQSGVWGQDRVSVSPWNTCWKWKIRCIVTF